MDIDQHIEALRWQGALLAGAVEDGEAQAPVPWCEEWTLRDLVCHVGGVHRWAAIHISEARPTRVTEPLDILVGAWPPDDELAPWYLRECTGLADALEGAPPDLQCFTFLPSATPLAMWARRQCHEATIHRVDAQRAAGIEVPTTIPTAQAVDGIDEILTAFVPRSRTGLTTDPACTMLVEVADAPRSWLVTIGPQGTTVDRVDSGKPQPAQCVVSANAHDLHLLLWNRGPISSAGVGGNGDVLELFLDRVHIRWG